jgi:hypothetical protein
MGANIMADNYWVSKEWNNLKQSITDPADPLQQQVGGDHYTKMQIQPVEYITANELTFLEGCIVKYISRWRNKDGIKDLHKIKQCVDLIIKLEKL